MARIGLKGMTYATVNSGGEGSAVTYTGGATQANLMITANVTLNRDDAKQYADNATVERVNGINGAEIKLELARLDDDKKAALLGYVAGTSSDGTLTVTDAAAPYVGFGYITNEVKAGVNSYVGYWFYKVQFGMDDDNASTKGERTEFQSVNLTGEAMGVQLETGGPQVFYITKTAATESEIRTWLNGLAGITG